MFEIMFSRARTVDETIASDVSRIFHTMRGGGAGIGGHQPARAMRAVISTTFDFWWVRLKQW